MALVLNGSSQYAKLPRAASDALGYFNNGAAFTFAIWFKPSLSANMFVGGTSIDQAGGYDNCAGIYCGATNVGWQVDNTRTSVASISNNTWCLAVVSRPAGGGSISSSIYINGTLSTNSIAVSNDYQTRGFCIGARLLAPTTPGEMFTGSIGSFAIWKGRQLNAGELASINSGSAFNTVSSGLTEYVDFVGTGTPATLTSSSGKTLTLYGSPSLNSDAPITITSVNGGSAITAGKSGVTSVSTGFSGLPTTITTNASGVTCSGIGGTTNAATFSISDRVDGALYPKSGTSVNFTFTKGAETAAASQSIVKKSTETIVPIAAPLFIANTLAQVILDQTGRTIVTGDEFYHTAYSDLVITADTDFTVTDAGSFDLWLWVSAGADAGKMYQYDVTVSGSGEITIDSSGLTLSGLTLVGFTASGFYIS